MEIDKLPVYKLYIVKLTIEAKKVPQELREEMMQKHHEYMAQVGGRSLLDADMSWSSEEFDAFGVEEFPNLEALIQFHDCLKQLHWFDYIASKTHLGFNMDMEGNPVPFVPPPPLEPGTKPIFKVWLMRPTALYHDDVEGRNAVIAKFQEAAKKAGVEQILSVYSRFNNEEYQVFGLERYPNLQAFAEKQYIQEMAGWYKYVQGISFLGRPISGLLAG